MTMAINNYNATVNLIKKFLIERNIVIDKFYLFGSRARNDFSNESDYDFMIVINNDLKPSEKRTVIADIYRYLIKENALIVMDLIIKPAKIFYSESGEKGYLAYTVLKEGKEL
jgi:uncharacterized protein